MPVLFPWCCLYFLSRPLISPQPRLTRRWLLLLLLLLGLGLVLLTVRSLLSTPPGPSASDLAAFRLVAEPLTFSGSLPRTTKPVAELRKALAFSVHLSAPDYNGVLSAAELEAKYLGGLLLNLQYLPYFYPGWDVRVYMADTLSAEFIKKVKNFNQYHPQAPGLPRNEITVELYPTPDRHRAGLGNAWRYVIFDSPDYDVVACRDTDALPTPREVAAVHAWLESGALVHSMHDHPDLYDNFLLAGLTAYRREVFQPFITQHGSIREYFLAQPYAPRSFDQVWLDAKIWPVAHALNSYVAHAQVSIARDGYQQRCTPFPTPRLMPKERIATGPFVWASLWAERFLIDGKEFEEACLIDPQQFPTG